MVPFIIKRTLYYTFISKITSQTQKQTLFSWSVFSLASKWCIVCCIYVLAKTKTTRLYVQKAGLAILAWDLIKLNLLESKLNADSE